MTTRQIEVAVLGLVYEIVNSEPYKTDYHVKSAVGVLSALGAALADGSTPELLVATTTNYIKDRISDLIKNYDMEKGTSPEAEELANLARGAYKNISADELTARGAMSAAEIAEALDKTIAMMEEDVNLLVVQGGCEVGDTVMCLGGVGSAVADMDSGHIAFTVGGTPSGAMEFAQVAKLMALQTLRKTSSGGEEASMGAVPMLAFYKDKATWMFVTSVSASSVGRNIDNGTSDSDAILIHVENV